MVRDPFLVVPGPPALSLAKSNNWTQISRVILQNLLNPYRSQYITQLGDQGGKIKFNKFSSNQKVQKPAVFSISIFRDKLVWGTWVNPWS